MIFMKFRKTKLYIKIRSLELPLYSNWLHLNYSPAFLPSKP